MVHLTLTGLSEDGRTLLFVSDEGVEFTADVDARLRAALQARQSGVQAGHQVGQGQVEMQMDSTLRPRDIQARIRAGETPETVAQVAGTSVDKVMPYAAPVLAERAHVAQRAQRASIRRPPGDGPAAGSGRTLGEAVGSHLRGRNVDPDSITWDAWRREDGRWTVTGAYAAGGRVGSAHFSFDAPGNYVVADDDDAHWLLGEVPDAPAAPEAPAARDDLSTARRRRLSAVPPDELPLGEDALELVSEPRPRHPDQTASLGAEQPVEAYLDEPLALDDPTLDDQTLDSGTEPDDTELDDDLDDTATQAAVPPDDSHDDSHGAGASDDSDADQSDHARHEPPSRKPVKKTRGRASVPSWDEIMFGGGAEE